jgi:hypothetical protein
MSIQALSGSLMQAGRRLVRQADAQLLVPPRAGEAGFWFGAGNIWAEADGSLLLCGRYRNGGDSRVGIEAGPRGAELAVLRSEDGGRSFDHLLSLGKGDLAPPGEEVLSVEGSCLRRTGQKLELYVASEKRADYPDHLREFQKPGTGVWSIDVLRAPTAEGLASACAEPVLRSKRPERLHVKDPVVTEAAGRTWMLYSCHPFTWASSNTGLAELRGGRFVDTEKTVLPRGPVWDVGVTRITGRLALPRVGVLADLPPLGLYFYDGAECMRDHGARRGPRGHSCEELGGLAAAFDGDFPRLTRLSLEGPAFVSPHGTGCSRYVSVYVGEDEYLVTWQRSEPDLSQPLVMNRIPRAEVEAALGA